MPSNSRTKAAEIRSHVSQAQRAGVYDVINVGHHAETLLFAVLLALLAHLARTKAPLYQSNAFVWAGGLLMCLGSTRVALCGWVLPDPVSQPPADTPRDSRTNATLAAACAARAGERFDLSEREREIAALYSAACMMCATAELTKEERPEKYSSEEQLREKFGAYYPDDPEWGRTQAL